MPLRKVCLILLLAAAPAMAVAAVKNSSLRVPGEQASLAAREHLVWAAAVHDSEFAAIPRVSTHNSCAATQPPEALATPNPLLDQPDPVNKVTVSFIIGTDGRVHSPLILESNGTSEDRSVLDAVRSWRYRPAMCNGVPTEAEAKIEFSSR
jgi:TonB family protein